MDIRNCLQIPHYKKCDLNMDIVNEMNSNTNYEKEIIIDYNDWTDLRNVPNDILLNVHKYFKRSIVNKNTKSIIDYPREIIPISYGVRNDFIEYDREFPYRYDVCCLFQLQQRSTMRQKIPHIVNMYQGSKYVGLAMAKNYNDRYNSINEEYFRVLKSSKIIVTANPPNWEGDYRLWEALFMGNLVLCDRMIMEIDNPLINGEHIIYYDDESELLNLIEYYIDNEEERNRIGQNGREHVMKYHKFSDRIDEVLFKI